MPSSTVRYTVRVCPAAHALDVTVSLEGLPAGAVRLALPTWVPGAYGFMKYGRDLSSVRACEGDRALTVVRDGWSGFRVEDSAGTLEVRYRVDAYDPLWGELTGLVDHEFAVLLGTHLLAALDHRGAVEVRYEFPEGWKVQHPAGAEPAGPSTWRYPSYAVLLDTPVVAGHFERFTRTSHDVFFHCVFVDGAVGFASEAPRFLDAVMKVADRCHALFGSYPFADYTFVFSCNPTARWGLEHANSTMISLGEDVFVDPDAFARAMRVTAHELFHAWNVCRLKPTALAKPDFVKGSFPDGLWVSEGFTRYYEFLLCVRAGELSPEAFFSNLVNYYRHLEALPAYQRVTPRDSSLATFLNHNRYPGSVNNTLDYYDQGMLVAFDLDSHLRLQEPPRSLDVEFRAFYEAFAGEPEGFSHEQVLRFFGTRTPGAEALLRREVEAPAGLSVPQMLERLGFEVIPEKVRFLGLVLKDNCGPEVLSVLDGSPVSETGLAAGDVLLRVNDYPYSLKSLLWLVKRGEPLRLHVQRGHRYFTFEAVPKERVQVGSLAWKGSPQQAARLREWLGRPEFQPTVGQAFSLASYENFHWIQTVR